MEIKKPVVSPPQVLDHRFLPDTAYPDFMEVKAAKGPGVERSET
jgi:hypothetical protein